MALTQLTQISSQAGISTTIDYTMSDLVVDTISVGGTITYNDVTSVDSIGIITARKGIQVLADGLNVTGVSTFAGLVDINNAVNISSGLVVNSGATLDSAQVSDLTDNRVVIAGASGELEDSGNLTFDGSTLAVTGNQTLSGSLTAASATISGDVSIADKIIHIGDTNTSLRFPSADTITAETGGSERLRITSGGHIIAGGQGSTIEFNNVGDGSFGSVIEIDGSHTTDHHGMLSIVGKTDTNGNVVGRIQFINSQNSSGSSGGNAGSRNLASIEGRITTTDSNAGDDCGGYLRFVTKADGGGNTERLRIDSNGNFGFGDTAPANFTGYTNLSIHGSTGGAITFGDNGTDEWEIYGGDGILKVYDRTNTSERLRIDSSGRLLLGTTTEGHADADDLTIATSGNSGITIRSGTTSSGGIFFSDATSGTAEYDGWINFGHDAKRFDIGINNATRLRITVDGYVGVKRSSPLANLHTTNNELAIGANPTSAAAPNATYDGLVVDGEAASFINIRSRGNGSDSYGRLAFSDDVRSRAYVEYRHKDSGGDDTMRFATAGSERLRITSGGDIQLQGGIIYGDDSALPTFTIANTSGNSNNVKITLGENVGSDNGGIAFYTAGSSSSDLKMRIRGSNDFIDIIDNNTLRFNDGKVTINHTGTHGYLTNTTGTFYIKGDTISLNKEDGTNVMWTNGSEMRFYPSDYGFGGAVPGGTPAGKNVFLAIGDSDTGIVQDGDGQLEIWGNAVEIVHFNAIDGYVSTKPISTSGDITASGGAGAVTLAANADIRLVNGTWTGDYGAKIQHHDNYLFLQGGSNGVNLRNAAGSRQLNMSNDGHFGPANGQAYNLGSSSLPWAQGHFADHIYIADTICHTGDTNTKIRFPSNDTIQLETGGASHIKLDANGLLQVGVGGGTVWNQTDSGTRFHTHLCTGSFYSGTGQIIIRTNIPSHDVTGHTMFSVRITGYWYSATTGGCIDCVVGCYSGENAYYNPSITGTYPNNWQDNVHFSKCSTGDYNNKMVIRLGTTSGSNNCEIACTDFVQGFSGTNIDYARNWSMIRVTDATNYNGSSNRATHRANEHFNEEFRTLGDNYGELMLARRGKGSTIQGEYQYTQYNQSQNYEHLIRGPGGETDITDSFAAMNWSALISVGVVGTSTLNTACHYYFYDNSDDNNSLAMQHRFGNSSASDNCCYMVINGGRPAWKMNHSGSYRVTVRVKFLTGGTDGATYTTAEGDYQGN